VNSGGLMSIASGAIIGGTTTLSGGTIGLAGDGAYTIPDLAATGGTVKLASGGSVGRSLTVDNLSGSANFVINTDLAAGTADQITVGSATGSTANTLAVNYDPAYATGQTPPARPPSPPSPTAAPRSRQGPPKPAPIPTPRRSNRLLPAAPPPGRSPPSPPAARARRSARRATPPPAA
jgi:hypothetical protein